MRMRWTAYAGASTALAAGVVVKALAQRPNFYSAAVYLAQSSANLMVSLNEGSCINSFGASQLTCVMSQILTNLIFMLACGSLLLLQKVLYGPLRPIEVEQLYEKAWFAVTETCLAMTIFRGEIGASFLIMFFALLAGKVWGWIGEGRVEILEQQPPANPRLFHTRLMISLILSVAFDYTMLDYIVNEVVGMARPDMMVMFGFEFAILTILSLSTLARYAISLVEIKLVRTQKDRRIEEIKKERRDARDAHARAQVEALANTPATGEQATTAIGSTTTSQMPPPGLGPDDPIDDAEVEVEGWEEKGRYVFYLDLMTDFLKLVIYLSFFFILLVFYGLPIHIMRDVFLTCRSFFKRIADFIRYRTATRDMNERYPDATPEEIGGSENVCIICREEMRPLPPPGPNGAAPLNNPVMERMRPKKLPCGHILHFSCLRSWLERQQICPTCRRPVVPTPATQARARGGNAPAAQLAPGQPAVPGQPVQGQGQAGDDQNRARVFQIGPLRIGVGAGRGAVEDMVQQIHNGEVPPQQVAIPNGANQYAFGFGIGRGNRRPRRDQATTIHGQIDQAERHIRREIDNLRLATNELQVVRTLQAELERLRALRGAVPSDQNTPTPTTQTHTHATPGGRPAQAFVANSQQNVLQAGSEALPQGLALPEGWSMLPLQRVEHTTRQSVQVQQHQIPLNFMHHPTTRPSGPMGGTPNIPAVPVQAMFSGQPPTWTLHPAQQQEAPPATNGAEAAHDPMQLHGNATSLPAALGATDTLEPSALQSDNINAPSATNGETAAPLPTSSLPSWGSAATTSTVLPSRSQDPEAMQPADSTIHPEEGRQNGDVPPIAIGIESGVNRGQGRSENASTSKGKQASVEELIEDPD
jgi:E3 ubiquitin-protein ligase synoviolin